MMWRECAWCKEKGIVTVIGCYDYNGDQHTCRKCTYHNCPSPLAETSSCVCDDCIEDHRKDNPKLYAGEGHA